MTSWSSPLSTLLATFQDVELLGLKIVSPTVAATGV